jgi:IS1 family transposase
VNRSKDVKCNKIKIFMKLLAEIGFIVRTPSNQNGFELYCSWAGGNIVRVGRKVLCVNKALEVMPNVSRQ